MNDKQLIALMAARVFSSVCDPKKYYRENISGSVDVALRLKAEVDKALPDNAPPASTLNTKCRFRVIETDNFGGDYPDEKFVGPIMTEVHAQKVADAINAGFGEHCSRYWRVVDKDYKLQPGFEP